jgi:hypothetical protein
MLNILKERKENQYDNRIMSFYVFIFIDLQKYEIDFIKRVFSFMLNLKKECLFFFKNFYGLNEIQRFLKLYESIHRDTETYIPDILCI